MKEYIERAVTLQVIDSNISHLRVVAGESALLNRAVDLVQYTRDFIANVPAADVVECKRGEWVQIGYDELMDRITCSCCNEYFSTIDNCTEQFNFCPNCGADMRGVDHAET